MKRNEVVGEPGASPSSATLHSYIFNNVFCLNCLYFCVQNQRQRQNQTITTFNATRNTGYHWFSLPALKPFGLSISLLLLILPQIHLKCFALFCPSQWKMEDNKMLPNRGTRKLQTHHTHTHTQCTDTKYIPCMLVWCVRWKKQQSNKTSGNHMKTKLVAESIKFKWRGKMAKPKAASSNFSELVRKSRWVNFYYG